MAKRIKQLDVSKDYHMKLLRQLLTIFKDYSELRLHLHVSATTISHWLHGHTIPTQYNKTKIEQLAIEKGII